MFEPEGPAIRSSFARRARPSSGPPGPSEPPPPAPPRSQDQALAEIKIAVQKQCGTKTWPMLQFTLPLRRQSGYFVATRRASREWHPAIDCVVGLINDARFEASESAKDEWPIPFELTNPNAPVVQVAAYRRTKALTHEGQRLRREAQRALSTDAKASLYGEARNAHIRAGQSAEGLAELIVGSRGRIQGWQVHYAEVSRDAIRAFASADADSQRQIANLPVRKRFVDCSRDLQDAGRLARKAKKLLENQPDLVVFFSQRAAAYAKHQDLRPHCQAK